MPPAAEPTSVGQVKDFADVQLSSPVAAAVAACHRCRRAVMFGRSRWSRAACRGHLLRDRFAMTPQRMEC